MANGPYYGEGTYQVNVNEVAFQMTTKAPPRPMIVLKFTVTGFIPSNGDAWTPEQEQYERRIYMMVDPDKPKQKEFVLMKLREAGWNGEKFEELGKWIIGQNIKAKCYHKEDKDPESKYFGTISEGWDLPLPPLESEPLENDPNIAKKLNAMFGKTLKETSKPASPPAPRQTVPPEDRDGTPPDDEVPF